MFGLDGTRWDALTKRGPVAKPARGQLFMVGSKVHLVEWCAWSADGEALIAPKD